MSHLWIFLVLLGMVARQGSAVDLLTLCHGKLSGTLLPNPYDCGSYYVCQSGPQLAYCGEGLHFDRVHKVCNWPETANCRLSKVEEEESSHSTETLKEDSIQDESNEMDGKPNNLDSDLTQDKSIEKIVELVSTQDESNEKIVKDESNEVVAKPNNPVSELSQEESNEKIVESSKPNSIEGDQIIKEDSTQELVDTIDFEEEQESNAKPIHLPLAQADGLESLIPSPLSKDPSPGDLAEKDVAVMEKEESHKTPAQAIEVPIVVHGDRPHFLTSNSSKPSSSSPDHANSIIAVQVPVSVLRPNQIAVEKEEEISQTVLVTEGAAPEDIKPTIELHMPVKGGKNTIVNGPNVNGHAEEKLDSSKPSHSASHIIAVNVPVHNFEINSSTVNGSSSDDEENTVSSKPVHNATHVIEVHVPVHPIDVASSIVNVPFFSTQLGGNVEAEAGPPTQSQNATHVIEVHVPVHPIEVGNFIVNAHNSTGQAEHVVEKVEVTDLEGKQVFEQQGPSSIELPDTIVEKVGSTNEVNHVIELHAPVYVADISNAIQNAINAIPNADSDQSGSSNQLNGLPADISNAFVSAVVERVDPGKPTTGSGQVIELSAPVLPVEVSNAIMNAVNAVQQTDVLVEKVDYVRPTSSISQVIELPAQGLPADVPNVIVNAVIAEVESAKPSESFGQTNPIPLKVSNAIVNTGNDIPLGGVLVEKVENPSNQFFDLSVPEFPAAISSNFANNPAIEFHASSAEKFDSVPQTSESLESVQLSKDSSNSESSEEAVAKVESSEEDPNLYQSSEDVHQEDNEAEDNVDSMSLEDHLAVPQSGQSSEENIAEMAESTFGSQSAESHKTDSSAQQNLGKVDSQSSEEDLAFAAPQESSEEELDQKNEESIEETPLSIEEDKQTTDSVSSSEHIPSKPNNRPTQQRPITDVVKDKRPAKKPSTHKPKPSSDRNVTGQSNSPTASQIDVNSTKQQWNLTEVIMSVGANTSTNGTVIRPVVGAHDTNTGDPIDVMIDYNSKNVQCIHNGLYFLPHPSNCQKYFICAYRRLHLHSCGDNLIWSYKRERCELELDSRCYSNETLIADPKPEKSTRPARENKYEGTTAATKGVRTSTPMPPLRTTNPSTLAETPQIFDEELPNCPSVQQAYLPCYDDCNKYYICILGHAVLTSCPDKLHWDAIGEFCGRSTKARCATRIQKISTK